MQDNLRLRVPALEWSVLEGRGELQGLAWVDSSIDIESDAFSVHEYPLASLDKHLLTNSSIETDSIRQRHSFIGELQTTGHLQFKHRSYEKYLPKIMTISAQEAQSRGEPTILEGLQLLYARLEWLIKARPYFWSSLSPIKDLMAILAESYGISPELHNSDRDVLARVLATMPKLYPHRGKSDVAITLWKDTLDKRLDIDVSHVDSEGAYPKKPNILEEVFLCHKESWWGNRLPNGVRDGVKENYKSRLTQRTKNDSVEQDIPSVSYPMNLRIEGGVVRFQLDDEHQQVPLVKEDIMIKTDKDTEIPSAFFQLLPNWVSVRLILGDR